MCLELARDTHTMFADEGRKTTRAFNLIDSSVLRKIFDTAFFVFLALAIVTGVLCFNFGGKSAVASAVISTSSLIVFIVPQLIAGLMIGGLLQALIDREWMERTLGGSSGIRGLAIAAVGGALTPGGPFTSFPVVMALWRAGVDVGVLVSYIAAWALIGIHRIIVWELPFLGPELALFRFALGLPMPFLAGLLARTIARRTNFLRTRTPENGQ